MSMTVINAADRLHWANEWLTSRQSFPGTGNYDLFGNAHGVLVMHNDDVVDPGEGLDAHHHQNMEILTWVLDGGVTHRDSLGHEVTLGPGVLGRMTAGTGITHSERNASTRAQRESLRVIQMWVAPDTDGLEPSHSEHDVAAAVDAGNPVLVASGRPSHTDLDVARINNRYAALWIARPLPDSVVTLPGAPYGHLFVARGAATVEVDGETRELTEGDAARLVGSGDVVVRSGSGSRPEILYWEMHTTFDLVRP